MNKNYSKMVYKIRVKEGKAGSFFKLMKTLKELDVIEEITFLDEEENMHVEDYDTAMLWSDDVRRDIGSIEGSKDYDSYVDFD